MNDILYFITTLSSTIVINNMTTVERHKLMFDEKILAEFDKRKENSIMLTRAQYESTVERLKLIENGEHRTLIDFNMIRRFGLMRVQVNDTIVEKLVQSGTDKRIFKND